MHDRVTMPSLIHLIYASGAAAEPSAAELTSLLRVARKNNGRVGLTGMLLYTNSSFFQVLEGEPAAVDAIFHTIAADTRHTQIVTIIRERIPRRSFGQWSMGFATATSEEIVAATGLNDFFAHGACLDQLDGGRAKKLLSGFRDGRWRASLDGAPAPVGAAASELVNA